MNNFIYALRSYIGHLLINRGLHILPIDELLRFQNTLIKLDGIDGTLNTLTEEHRAILKKTIEQDR